jgi:hypothetical protein
MFGVTTYYRKEPDGSLSIKLEGKLEGVPLFEQVAVIREVDLHKLWAPFCTSSLTVKEMDKLDTVGWFVMGVPQLGLSRDGCFRAIGCDNILEDGSILIVGQGLRDRPDDVPYAEPYFVEGLEGLDLPEKPIRMGSGRMTIRHFSANIDVISPTCCNTKMVANIDPNLPLPQNLLDFVTRKICGVIIYKLQSAAKRAANDPVRNAHSQRMRQEHEFYEGWLLPKFEGFCRMNKWAMPKVTSLNLTEEEQEEEFEYNEGHKRHARTLGIDSDGRHGDESSSSSVSRITFHSTMTNNPLSRRLQEMEENAERKRARKISAARLRAANRLKPRHLSEDERCRLEELKDAKARRNRNDGIPSTMIEVEKVNEKKREKEPLVSWFHDHTRSTRLLTTTALCCVMAIVLNPDVFISNMLEALEDHASSWWTTILLDIGTFVYISFCSIVHFVVCDVAMVYAFGALDLGMKTGKQSKQYYSDSVRMLVAAMSGSIAAFSAGKAMLTVLMRATVWYSMLGLEAVQMLGTHLHAFLGGYLPFAIVNLPGNILSLCTGGFTFVVKNVSIVANYLTWLFYAVFVNSNRLCQLVEAIVNRFIKLVPSWHSHWKAYQQHVRDVYEDTDIVPSWRSDAIETTRFLLAYTAVFLLSILVLFNASSRANKRKNAQWDALANSPSMALFHEATSLGATPVPTSSHESTRFGEYESNMSTIDDYSVSVSQGALVDTSAESKQPRFKLRLRKRHGKAETAPA